MNRALIYSAAVLGVITYHASSVFGWESVLFPKIGSEYTRPIVTKDSLDYQLPDYSYAGYYRGEKPIPDVPVEITLTPAKGDNIGQINEAIRKLSKKRLNDQGFRGAILLTKGMYEITDEIKIYHSGIVLRGEGADKTFIYVNSTNFARKNAIKVVGPESDDWSKYRVGEQRIVMTADAPDQALFVVVEKKHPFSTGEQIIIRQWPSMEYSKLHGADGVTIWPASNDKTAPRFCRTITQVNGDTLFFDQPLRYPILTRFGAHVHKAHFLIHSGIENLAIGFIKGSNTENNGPTHRATAIIFSDVMNGWIRGVESFKKDSLSVHLQSYGFTFRACKSLTIENCVLQEPQNKGVGGNGYLYNPVMCDGLLIKKCKAMRGRHNFTFIYCSSGCVVTDCYSAYSRTDHHQYLAPENLFDNITIEADSMTMGNRGDKSQGAWWTADKGTFWNIKGTGAIYLNCFDRGYAIGIEPGVRIGKGPINRLQDYGRTYHDDRQWIEVDTTGAAIEPESLYETQLRQRLAKLRISANAATEMDNESSFGEFEVQDD